MVQHVTHSCSGTLVVLSFIVLFFFTDTATTEIYTLSLHDALPIFQRARRDRRHPADRARGRRHRALRRAGDRGLRSEEHTSELQSRLHLVCRLLLEKKKQKKNLRQIPQMTNNTVITSTHHTGPPML